jgi:hypothetical protein
MTKLRGYRTPSPLRLVLHVLDHPELVAAVRELPPAALGRLIDAVGLEDAGELVALSTTAQLERVFDDDLWRSDQAGDDPHFDPVRFGTWLEVLLEAGEKAVAERLCELSLDFTVFAFSRLVLVVDMDQLGVELAEDEETLELTEKALDSTLAEEWEEFRIIGRNARSWDAVLAALLALDRDHHDTLRRVLERLAAVSAEYIDDNGGLYDVLSSDELLESDARAERDDRRAAAGYVAPSDARAFLALARGGLDEASPRDAVTRAYFRELDESAAPRAPIRHSPRGTTVPPSPDVSSLLRLVDDAAAAGNATRSPGPAALTTAASATLLRVALVRLAERRPAAHAERIEELAYLTNVIVAGDSTLRGRAFRPVEALERAIALAELGLELALDAGAQSGRGETASQRADRAAELLETEHLDRLFRIASASGRGASRGGKAPCKRTQAA